MPDRYLLAIGHDAMVITKRRRSAQFQRLEEQLKSSVNDDVWAIYTALDAWAAEEKQEIQQRCTLASMAYFLQHLQPILTQYDD